MQDNYERYVKLDAYSDLFEGVFSEQVTVLMTPFHGIPIYDLAPEMIEPILAFDEFLKRNFKDAFILRFNNDYYGGFQNYGSGWWFMFAHRIEQFYQWLFAMNSECTEIVNDQSRTTQGALDAIRSVFAKQLPTSTEIRRHSPHDQDLRSEVSLVLENRFEPGFSLAPAVRDRLTKQEGSVGLEPDLCARLIELATTGRHLIRTGHHSVVLDCSLSGLDGFTIERDLDNVERGFFGAVVAKTNYHTHLLRALEQATWSGAHLVVDLIQHQIDLKYFHAAYSIYREQIQKDHRRTNSSHFHERQCIALYEKNAKANLLNLIF